MWEISEKMLIKFDFFIKIISIIDVETACVLHGSSSIANRS